MHKKIAFSVLFLAIFGMLPAMTALAADNTWTQTDWTGGTDGGSVAAHPADQAGWNQFSSVTDLSATASPGSVTFDRAIPGYPDDPGYGGTMIRNGSDDAVYSAQNGSTGFLKYSISGNTWTKLAPVPGPVSGGAMIRNAGDDDIYLLQGNGTGFYKYSISGNTWTILAVVPNSADGGTLIRNGGNNDIYLLRAQSSTDFLKYSISGDTWTALANVPEAISVDGDVDSGAKMIRNEGDDDIYVLATALYKYSISGNTWTTLKPVPGVVGVGGGRAMSRNGADDDIYVLQGAGTKNILKYSISGNSWTALAPAPELGGVYFGGAMSRNGGNNDIYVLHGNGARFSRYSISGNTWTTLAAVPHFVGAGTVLIRNGGDDDIYVLESFNDLDSPERPPLGSDKYYKTDLFKYSISDNSWTGTTFVKDPLLGGKLSGNLVSSVYDSNEANNAIGGLSWTENVSLPAGTSVTISLRTAQAAGGFIDNWQSFTDATAGCTKRLGVVTCPASSIPVPLTDGGDNRFVQYKVTETNSGAAAPTVGNIVVTYFVTAEQAPNTLIDTRPTGRVNATTATFTFHGTETGGTLECKLDLGSFAPCTSPLSYTGLVDGPHAFQVRATDAGGHADSTPTTAKWTVDTIPPNTIIVLRPSGRVNPTTATLTFIATHTTATGNTFECLLEPAKDFTPCTSPIIYTGLFDKGHYTFFVRATDAAGNTDPTATTARWTVGLDEPGTIVDLRPLGTVNTTSATFSFHATKAGGTLTAATFECKTDLGAYEPCTSPKTYSGFSEGAHAFKVRATDALGHTDPTPTLAVWTIDTVSPPPGPVIDGDEPNTLVDLRPLGTVNTTSATFTFHSTKLGRILTGSTFECRVDLGTFEPCTSPKEYTGLSEGAHAFKVRATDADGHTDSTPTLAVWRIDTTP